MARHSQRLMTRKMMLLLLLVSQFMGNTYTSQLKGNTYQSGHG